MKVFLLGSGSSGNAALVEHEGHRIFVDAGIGPKRAALTLGSMGVDLLPRAADAIVITHEHDDHVAKLESLARALKAPVYLHRGLHVPRVRARFPFVATQVDDRYQVGPFSVRTMRVPHDVTQVALRIEAGRSALGWVTDMGHVPASLVAFFEGCHTVLLEANYDRAMLDAGPYPARLRSRVGGPLGHLDNEDSAELAARLEREGVERIVLGHLSAVNNTPERALRAVRRRAQKLLLDVIPHAGTAQFEVGSARRAVQLALFA